MTRRVAESSSRVVGDEAMRTLAELETTQKKGQGLHALLRVRASFMISRHMIRVRCISGVFGLAADCISRDCDAIWFGHSLHLLIVSLHGRESERTMIGRSIFDRQGKGTDITWAPYGHIR